MTYPKIIFVVIFISVTFNLSALTSKTTVGKCIAGSESAGWTATWTFDDKASPKSLSAINCEGEPFSLNLNRLYNGNSPQKDEEAYAWIATVTENTIEVQSNKVPLVLRIINTQTGAWITEELEFSPLSEYFSIDTDYFEPGNYGIVVIYKNYPLQMLDFII